MLHVAWLISVVSCVDSAPGGMCAPRPSSTCHPKRTIPPHYSIEYSAQRTAKRSHRRAETLFHTGQSGSQIQQPNNPNAFNTLTEALCHDAPTCFQTGCTHWMILQ